MKVFFVGANLVFAHTVRGEHKVRPYTLTSLMLESPLAREYHGHCGFGFVAGLDDFVVPD